MNRHERRAQAKDNRNFVDKLPASLQPIPRDQWPDAHPFPNAVYRSRHYLVQIYIEDNPTYPGLLRMSVCRSKLEVGGRWQDGITWDELQSIKNEIGLGEFYAVEIYPPDRDVVNVANMRHLWILKSPLAIGWF